MKTSSILFTPVKIGNLEIKNRIVMAPMVTGQATPDGRVTDAHLAWYGARAKGGTGLIIVEMTAVAQGGCAAALLGFWDDSFIPKFRELTQTVHDHGARIFIQLSHAGRQTETFFTGGQQPVAPSAISCPLGEPRTKEIPRELTVPQIEEIIAQFGRAAHRAREAGFDGVEIHGAHGYLIAGFMSAYSNKRHDAYGGDLRGRMQFPLQIIKAVRQETGHDFPVTFRYSGNEYVPDGRTLEESRRVARMLEAAGVDALHIAAGVYESFWSEIPIHGAPEGIYANDAAFIKKGVNIPVIAVGRIKSPDVAEEILVDGKADMVALGRQLICDPEWPRKAAARDYGNIQPCIGCIQGCINRGIVQHKPVACVFNTASGMETTFAIKPAAEPKTVLVVGGGPGGLEAARVAALRGHRVRLYEKSEKLGGRFNLASVPPFKQEFATAIKWLVTQITNLNVDITLNTPVTAEVVEKIAPDAVVVATGAVSQMPNIPGIDRQWVVFGEDILAGKTTMGNRVVIIGGGGIGTEVADMMAQRHKDVTLVEMLPEIGVPTGIAMLVAQNLLPRLQRYGVTMLTGTTVTEITDDAVVVETAGVKKRLEGVDQVVVAAGAAPANQLAAELAARFPRVYTIGDAVAPRTLFEATHEGADAAMEI